MQLVLPLFSPKLKPCAPKKRGRTATVNGDGIEREAIVGGESIPYLFRRRRRKSIGFTIDQRGLIISAPRWVSMAEIDEAVAEKSGWIARKLIEWKAFEKRLASLGTQWDDGGTIRYIGHEVELRVTRDGEQEPNLDSTEAPKLLFVGLPAQTANSDNLQLMVEAWLQARAREILGKRLDHFGRLLGHGHRRWHLSGAKTQWGSCNADGVIRLNWRLVHLPAELLDYVVAHEVAHLRELNHSPAFWRVVEQLMPNYEQARQTLHAMPEHLAL